MVVVQPNIGNLSGKPSKNKPRKRVNTAEKRASHNLVERQRREQLNGRFLDLARLLPSLASQKRPSKSAIVNGSITHLTSQRNARLIAAKELRALFSENQEILQELNEYRVQTGKVVKVSIGWTAGMEEVVKVEDETFGTFTSFDEDGLDGDDVAEQEDLDAKPDEGVTTAYDLTATQAAAGQTGNSSLPSAMLAAYQTGMYMRPPIKQEPSMSRLPAYANPESSLASTSPSSQEAISNRQQALLMMQQSGHPLFARRAHISPTAGRGSFAHADSTDNLAQDFIQPSLISNGLSVQDSTDMPYTDKVTSWTQQQQMLLDMAQQRRNTIATGAQASWMDFAGLPQDLGLSSVVRSQSISQFHGNPLPSQLTAAHVTLLARQPHLAAAVFPPACSAEMAASAGLADFSPEHDLAALSQHTADASTSAFEQWQKSMDFSHLPTPPIPSTAPTGMKNVLATPTSTSSGTSPNTLNAPTVSELREAVRHGISVGMGMSLGMPTWSTEMDAYP
ncbi:hypothetical protein NliqN6_1921 [Naganishia liquefaciens]|uniref:BHLH domain-containing protein n=1 Tax=Naganishia liquefaciens TaxID=104408 RepID=A0A8H3TSN7_9TREE|nr:hypothetical protein NliqN6_1921 [Naganishia liquefaciens]